MAVNIAQPAYPEPFRRITDGSWSNGCSGGERLLIDLNHVVDHQFRQEVGIDVLDTAPGHGLRVRAVLQARCNGLAQRCGIFLWHEVAGSAVQDHLFYSPCVRGDNGQSAGQRFEDRRSESLRRTRGCV
jgi:hypothetical protein